MALRALSAHTMAAQQPLGSSHPGRAQAFTSALEPSAPVPVRLWQSQAPDPQRCSAQPRAPPTGATHGDGDVPTSAYDPVQPHPLPGPCLNLFSLTILVLDPHLNFVSQSGLIVKGLLDTSGSAQQMDFPAWHQTWLITRILHYGVWILHLDSCSDLDQITTVSTPVLSLPWAWDLPGKIPALHHLRCSLWLPIL